MDKVIFLSVAGSGKTSWIVNNIDVNKRNLILTYTNANLANIHQKLINRFGKDISNLSIDVQSFFVFLYHFCYLPFFADKDKPKGISFSQNMPVKIPKSNRRRYYDGQDNIYSGRISDYLISRSTIPLLIKRLEKYYDVIYIDEIQDIAGGDFELIENIAASNLNFYFLGDFYQHTFDSSRDGNKNLSLYENYEVYKSRFRKMGFKIDETTLIKSHRCKPSVCSFVTERLGICMEPVNSDSVEVKFISDENEIELILSNDEIVKLFYKESAKQPFYARNWADTKGEDHFVDVAVVLTQGATKFYPDKLSRLPIGTLRKLYVACTRARRNLYFINPKSILK